MVANKKSGERSKRLNKNAGNDIEKKPRREPLPMKLRALPQSFWQQPNTAGSAFTASFTPPQDSDDELRPTSESLVIGAPNTDLLFSLFKGLPIQEEDGRRPASRRGRPRKNKEINSTIVKDEDPYVTSAVVPEIKNQQRVVAEAKKVLSVMSFSTSHDNSVIQRDYAQKLDDLVFNL